MHSRCRDVVHGAWRLAARGGRRLISPLRHERFQLAGAPLAQHGISYGTARHPSYNTLSHGETDVCNSDSRKDTHSSTLTSVKVC